LKEVVIPPTMTPIKGTLIISPETIVKQWEAEIARHAPLCTVFKYDGVAQQKDDLHKIDFGSFDIVLTTYETLRKELHYAQELRALRHPKKYMPKRTPLIEHYWWRVCLDEAQMIETPTAHAAQMALKLETRHRWCVTGTPVGRGLDDLYGLALFLRIDPFHTKSFWSRGNQIYQYLCA